MRKLLMLAVMALAAMAFVGASATSAAADVPFEVRDHGTGELCEEMSGPYGGCVVEGFDGSFDIYGGYPTGFVNYFDTTFDLAVGPDGSGYALNQAIVSGPGSMAIRVPCDNAGGVTLPWPVEVRALGGGEFEADLRICIRSAAGSPGSGSSSTITLDVAHFGVDGWTELDQPPSTEYLRNGYWNSANTVDLVEVEG
jgi:hypothetical protein